MVLGKIAYSQQLCVTYNDFDTPEESCSVRQHITYNASQINSFRQDYFAVIRSAAADLCKRKVALEYNTPIVENWFIKAIDLDFNAGSTPETEDINRIYETLLGYPAAVGVHLGSAEIAQQIADEYLALADENLSNNAKRDRILAIYETACVIMVQDPRVYHY